MNRQFATVLLVGASLLPTTIAHAQSAASMQPAAVPTPKLSDAASPDTAAAQDAEIVITGSRVITNGNKSPTPVTVISTSQLLKVQPTTVVDAVNLAPALQGSQGINSNPGGGQRNGAAAYLNLRAMGDLRTLVLMDGHRVVPTINQNQGNVDAFVVPQMLIQRVDVVTGGVSAVYGSDAVSGVVNFVTDNKFNGFKMQGSAGISNYGDDKTVDAGIAYGREFSGGRGHIELSYEYRRDPGISSQYDRPFFAKALGGAGLGTAASPYYNVTNTRISSTSNGGLITSGPFAGKQFATNNVLSPFNVGTSTGTNGVSSGGDGSWYDTASIKSGLEFHQMFGRADYDFSSSVHGYLSAAGTINHTHNSYRAPLETATIGYNNPFVQAVPELAAQALLTPGGSFNMSKFFDIPATANQYTNTYMIHGGLDGTLGKYKWDFGFGQSMSEIKAVNEVNVDQEKFLAAVNAVRDPATGNTVCNAALTNPTYSGCVPLNMFGPTAPSAQALNYVLAQTWNRNTTTLSEFSASISGAPIDTWAGPVNMAISAEYRRTGWKVTSNAGPNDPVDCTGIQFGCSATTTRWLQTTMPALAAVHQDVKEIAYEADVPLAEDVSWAKALNLNGAVRYTNYSTSGGVTTWKLGLIYRPSNDWTFRGTVSRDIRAPNLFELFAPTTIAPTTVSDPAAFSNTAGRVGVATVSNSSLTPEKARSFTAGFVWSPSFIPHFSLTVDGYWIKVNNAISQLSGVSSSVLNGICGTPTAAAANPVCGTLIIRPTPTSFPSLIYNKYLNIASFKTYGADFEINYGTSLFGRAFDVRALVSWQPHLIFDQGPAGTIDLAGVATGVNLFPASPSVKFTVIANYQITDQLSVSVLERGRNALKAVGVTRGQVDKVFLNGKDSDPATAYTNLTVAYDIKGEGVFHGTQVYVNVQNLFNKQPDVEYAGASSSPGTGLAGFFPPNGDDIVGRYFTVGFRSHF